MKIGVVCSTKDPEILWNAFRFANLCLEKMDDVMLFLNCGAVAYYEVDSPKYKLEELLKSFTLSDGVLYS
jgi:uncharacterized protein involved in oxidation of intracellular sulfur